MSRNSSSRGVIVKSSGGFYTVEADDGVIECRARGIFRKEGRSPCVGDRVEIAHNPDGTGVVDEILPRRNSLVRPPLANLDAMIVVLSICDPEPNLFVADQLIAVLEHKGIEPVIAVTKSDLQDASPLAAIYENAGFAVYVISSETGDGVSALCAELAGKFCAFSGNSGVGKSSLLNAIDPRLGIEVSETSKKLGRGRHTTRHVETFTLPNGARVADTPGFSSIDIELMSDISKADLAACFREFAGYYGRCRFPDCSHTREIGCAVLAAAAGGQIAKSRHKSYELLFEQIKDVKEWERRATPR